LEYKEGKWVGESNKEKKNIGEVRAREI